MKIAKTEHHGQARRPVSTRTIPPSRALPLSVKQHQTENEKEVIKMNEKKDEKQYKFLTQTPVSKLVIKLGIPTTISMLVTTVYNMADTYFVSKIGTSASGAVGVVFGLMAIIQAVGFLFGHGSGSVISRKLGAKQTEAATKVASTGFFICVGFGVVMSVLGFVFLTPMMRLFGSTDTILPYAEEYATYILLACPFMCASFVLNNILRYEGKASFAMIGLVTGGLLNIFGDWLLMGYFKMGISGAGIATAVTQFISFLILLAMFLSGKTVSKIKLSQVSLKKEYLGNIVMTGLPSLVRQGLASVGTMVLNGYAGEYGDAAIAAMTIVNRLCFLVFAIGLGIGQGFQPVSAFNYGAKKYKRVKKAYFFTLGVGELLLGALAVIGIILSGSLIGIFRDDPDVIAIGTVALRAQFIALFLQPLCVCTNMLFQSIGKNSSATFLSTLRNGLAFIPVIIILTHFLGLFGIEIAQTVADFITFAISVPFAVVFFKKLPKEDF